MSDDEDDESRCPFCKEADGCKHLVAVFVRGDSAIGGGIFYEREEEFTALLRDEVAAMFATCGKAAAWTAGSAFAELWNDFLSRRESEEEEPLDSGLIAALLEDLLRDSDAISVGEDAVVAFFDRNPKKLFDKVVEGICRACITSREQR
jgi:hypothetical protein